MRLSVLLDSPWGEIELHAAHIVPGSTYGWTKIEMFEGIHRRLRGQSAVSRILCGDLNSPKAETPDGQIVTFGHRVRQNGTIAIRRGQERWASGELGVLQGLAQYGLPDIFREVNGYDVEAFSWFAKRKSLAIRRRFDHVFASGDLNAFVCQYMTHVVDQRLSDHAAIRAVFEPKA